MKGLQFLGTPVGQSLYRAQAKAKELPKPRAQNVVIECNYHHMPQDSDRPDLTGKTIREALKTLRTVSWGSLGGMTAYLSDGTKLCVVLTPTGQNGSPTYFSSQRAERISAHGKVIRRYKVR